MMPALQERVVEVHPELSFWALANGQPMEHPKRTPQGFEERRALLADALVQVSVPAREQARRLVRPAAADDVLDALVAAWTARRYSEGRSGRLPALPETDANGLRVEMIY